MSQLTLPHGTKVKNRKSKKNPDILRSISKQSGDHVDSPEEKKEGYGRKDLQKRKVLSME